MSAPPSSSINCSALPWSAVTSVIPPDPLPDSTDPTAECAKCNSTAVYVMEDGGLVCGKCGAKLAMELTAIAPG